MSPKSDNGFTPKNDIEGRFAHTFGAGPIGSRKIRLLIAVPSNTGRSMYPVPFVHSLIKLCREIPRDVWFELKYFGGLSIDVVRLQMARYAVDKDFDAILMLDDDMVFPEDTVPKLLRHYKAGMRVVGGIYQSKGYPFHFFLNRATTQFGVWDLAYEEGTHKVKLFGTGCLLIDTTVFKELHMPYFLLRKDILGNLTGTEDCYFAMNCYLNGVDAFIDTSILCEHIKMVTFPEFFTHPEIAYNGKINKYKFPKNNHIGSIWEDADKLKRLGKNYGKLAISPLTLSFFRDGIDVCAHSKQIKLPTNEGAVQKYKCSDCGLISEGVDAMEMLKKQISSACDHKVVKHGKCVNCELSEEEL